MNRRPALLPCMILYYSPREKPFMAGPPGESQHNIIEISHEDALFLTFCQGKLTLAEIATRLHLDKEQVSNIAAKFSIEPHVSLEFLDEVETPHTPDSHIEVATQILHERDSTLQFIDNPDQLHQYHVEKINDAIKQFEAHETTISHVYSQSHPSFGGIPYGARMAEKLWEMGTIDKYQTILEIGGGTGYLARDFLRHLKENQSQIFKHTHYVMLELSLTLQKSQRHSTGLYTRVISQVLGDALAMPFSFGSFSIIIANEMIADLPPVCLKKEWVNNKTSPKIPAEAALALKFITDFDIRVDDVFPEFLVNLGAWQLLEHIYHLLSPGGTAIIIEYGSIWRYPVAVHLQDHTEYAIHFGQLEKIAKKLGFKTKLEGLADFFEMDLDAPILERVSLTTLNQSLLPHLNIGPLPVRAFTPEMLKQALGNPYKNLHNLQFSSPKEGGCQGNPSVFYALTLKKEASSMQDNA